MDSSLPARAESFFVADIHWQPAGSGAIETGAFARFLGELACRARQGITTRLYVLGDLFDFWFERRGRVFPFFEPHLELLRTATAAGVQLFVLFGNRDFTYGSALPRRCGAQILGDRAELLLGARRALLQHGDLFCSRDWRYQLYRRLVRSRAVRLLMGLLPMRLMERLIGHMRAASRAEIGRKTAHAMGLADATVASAHSRGYGLIICGHVHTAQRRQVRGGPAGSEVIVLGAWSEAEGSFAAFDGRDLVLQPYALARLGFV
jgi:UDP-2,3-diacylglucosamine hydrolase